jgi:hypothetical protein
MTEGVVEGTERLPFIANVLLVRGDADDVATHWRARGYKVRVFDRSVRAGGAFCPVWAVVVVARRST